MKTFIVIIVLRLWGARSHLATKKKGGRFIERAGESQTGKEKTKEKKTI